MISSLPPEIFQEIAERLSLDEQKTLRLTCQDINVATRPLALRTIHINLLRSDPLNPGGYSQHLGSLLKTLARPNNNISPHVRELVIDASALMSVNPRRMQVVKRWRRTKFVRMLDKYLSDAILSLHGLCRVTWKSPDPQIWLDHSLVILFALSRLDSLRHLAVRCFDGTQLIRLLHTLRFPSQLSTLTVVTYQRIGKPEMNDIRFYLADTLPGLSSITIHTIFQLTFEEETPEEYELDLSHALRDPSKLQDVHLSDTWTLPMDRLSELVNLSSLHLESTARDVPWFAMKRSGIRLRRLSIQLQKHSDTLLEYLESYSGLELLSLSCSESPDLFSEYHGADFYGRILPQHAATLVHLCIEGSFGGALLLKPSSTEISGLSACAALEVISVPLQNWHNPQSLSKDDWQSIINMIASFSHLKEIRLCCELSNQPSLLSAFTCRPDSHIRQDLNMVLMWSYMNWPLFFYAAHEHLRPVLRCEEGEVRFETAGFVGCSNGKCFWDELQGTLLSLG